MGTILVLYRRTLLSRRHHVASSVYNPFLRAALAVPANVHAMGLLDSSDSEEEENPNALREGYYGTLTIPTNWANRNAGKQQKVFYGPHTYINKGETIEFTLKGPCPPDSEGNVTHWFARGLGSPGSLTPNRRDLQKKLMRDILLSGAEDLKVPVRLIKPAPRRYAITPTQATPGDIISHVERTTLSANRTTGIGALLALQSYFSHQEEDRKALEAGKMLAMGGATSGGGSQGTGGTMSHGGKSKDEAAESQGVSLDRKRTKRSRPSGASEFVDSEEEEEEERKSHLCATRDFNRLEIKKDDPVPARLLRTK